MVAILGILAATAPEHLTPVEIHRWLHAVGWDTDQSAVHRALAALTERGLIHPLPLTGLPAYGCSSPCIIMPCAGGAEWSPRSQRPSWWHP